ncbi:MAG: hypothetical protein P4M15_15320 [Alphaproteobacteria bacterium]|nr:hypothetical protein [Alphaproteobacteria bacterium]
MQKTSQAYLVFDQDQMELYNIAAIAGYARNFPEFVFAALDFTLKIQFCQNLDFSQCAATHQFHNGDHIFSFSGTGLAETQMRLLGCFSGDKLVWINAFERYLDFHGIEPVRLERGLPTTLPLRDAPRHP